MVYYPGIRSAGAVSVPVTLESTVDGTSGSTSTNLDTTITVPSSSNRLILDFIGWTSTTISSWQLDPGGGSPQSLTQFSGSPLSLGGSAAYLLNTGIGIVGSGSKTLRQVVAATRRPGRHTFIFSGASQAAPSFNSGEVSVGGALTITLTGIFEPGTYLAAFMFSNTTTAGAYTVTGTGGLVEIQDQTIPTVNQQFVAAGKLLTTQITNPTVIFTRDSGGNTNKSGFIVGIAPV